jgi:glycerophosphoryl diester phosphodiesterase
MMPPVGVAANLIDFEKLENLVIEATCEGNFCRSTKPVCDATLKLRIGLDFPRDLDHCAGDEQLQLMSRGLYRTKEGQVLNLPADSLNNRIIDKVALPDVQNETLNRDYSPYEIDLDKSNQKNQKNQKNRPQKRLSSVESKKIAYSTSADSKELSLGCAQFSTFAHRGAHTAPENSISGIQQALEDLHTGVEIDVQRIKDGHWVVYHDPFTGRATQGKRKLVKNFNRGEWKSLFLLDRQKQVTLEKPPFLSDALATFKNSASKGQLLNIEIKNPSGGRYECQHLLQLHEQVTSTLAKGDFMYSSTSHQSLQCLRREDKSVYLGVIVTPNPDSIKQEVNDTGIKVLQHLVEKLRKKPNLEAAYTNRYWLERADFQDLKVLLGPYFGLHVDYKDLGSFVTRLRKLGGRVMTYQLNDDAGMLSTLKSHANAGKTLPDGILVDTRRMDYCTSVTSG